MYTKFFGLNEKPFSITPDPRYLYLSERHSEGLAHLVYGVKESSGFIQLTGEVGTGKTTLVRTLLTRIPDGVEVALVLNPQLTAVEFLAAICVELKIPPPNDPRSKKELVDALNNHLLNVHAKGNRTILIIDEAQNLATDVLEQVRLLTNLETAKQKLLQIILIAQPELRDKLSQVNLRQLAQRVTGRYHLEPLTRAETSDYIEHRLKVAGGLGEIFDRSAKNAVYRFSGGIPRLINVICDRALLGAYSLEQRRITSQIVGKAATEVSGETTGVRTSRGWMPLYAMLVAGAIGAAWWWSGTSPNTSVAAPAAQTEAAAEQATETEEPRVQIVAAADVPPEEEPEPTPSLDQRLLSAELQSDSQAAMRALLATWNIDYVDGRATCEQAQESGLACLEQRGSWGVLRQLNRPAVMTLTDSTGNRHSALLVAVADDVATLRFADEERQVPASELSSLWFGEYQLLWQPPAGDPSIIRRGSRGPKVLWLRDSLAALDPAGNSSGRSDIFDDELEQRLLEFQRRNRLDTDGIAGQQTQIIINSQLGGSGTPRLAGS